MPSQTDFIQYKFDHYFIRENRSKDALNQGELCEIAIRTRYERKKTFSFLKGIIVARLIGGWPATFHTSIASKIREKVCDCRRPLFFICRSLHIDENFKIYCQINSN